MDGLGVKSKGTRRYGPFPLLPDLISETLCDTGQGRVCAYWSLYADTRTPHLGVALPVDVSFRDAPNAVPPPPFTP